MWRALFKILFRIIRKLIFALIKKVFFQLQLVFYVDLLTNKILLHLEIEECYPLRDINMYL